MELEKIIGLEEAKESMELDLLARAKGDQPQKMILLEGASGTCKTTLVQAMFNKYITLYPDRFVYKYLDTCNVTGHVTTTSLVISDYWNELRKINKPILLLIDEADEVLGTRKDAGFIKTERTVNIIKQLNDEIPNLYIVCTSNRPRIIDRAILERCCERINCPYPTSEELSKIIDVHLPFISQSARRELYNKMICSGQKWSGRDLKHIAERLTLKQTVEKMTTPDYEIPLLEVNKQFGYFSKTCL